MDTQNEKLYLPLDPTFLNENTGKGTFGDLIPNLPKYPAWVESSKQRLTRLIVRQGIDEKRTQDIQSLYGDPSLVAYLAFTRKFYGIEVASNAIMNGFFAPAQEGHGADKKILCIVGPPSGGKSDIVTEIKNIWRTGEPVPMLDECPVHDNPLSLLLMIRRVALSDVKGFASKAPGRAEGIISSLNLMDVINWGNPRVKQMLSTYSLDQNVSSLAKLACTNEQDFLALVSYGLGLSKATINNIGLPCPWCQAKLYGKHNREKVDFSQFALDAMQPAMGDGIVDVSEVEPVNFDLATWIGRRNIGKIGKVTDDNPDSVEPNGFFCRAHRGLLILTENLKNPPEAHRVELEASQGRRIRIPEPLAGYHQDGLSWEGIILGHTNEEEYLKFKANKANEAYWDRYFEVKWKYPLEASQAAKVSRKLYAISEYASPQDQGGVHLEPILLGRNDDDQEAFEPIFRTLTCLESDSGKVPLMTKLEAYNGKLGRPTGHGQDIQVAEIRSRASTHEGMSGLSPRKTAEEVLGYLAARAKKLYENGKIEKPCVTSRDFRDAMFEWMRNNVSDTKALETYRGFLNNELETWRRRSLSKVVRAAFLETFNQQCQETFDKYIEWSNAAVLGETPKTFGNSRTTKMEMEEWLRKIETQPQVGIELAQSARFRQGVQASVTRYTKKNSGVKQVPYTIHNQLKECIEKFVLAAVTEVAKIMYAGNAKTPDEQKKYDTAQERLIKQHGFCPYCAAELFSEVSNTRGFLTE